MGKALLLAEQALGTTAPNPAVGCVLVKDGKILSEGATKQGGRPHAEQVALMQVEDKLLLKGATAYVTLEPCAHVGETPSCAGLLKDAGIARVVVAVIDPDKRVKGQGLEILKLAGVRVDLGLGFDEGIEINRAFFRRQHYGLPYITLKVATSLDGKVATVTGHSQWITSQQARDHGHGLRARSDAILTGSGTVLADDPMMTCRLNGYEHCSPIRIVLDRRGRVTPNHKIIKTANEVATWVYGGDPQHLNDTWAEPIAEIDPYDLKAVMMDIANRGINSVMIEAGAELSTAFMVSDMVDEIYWYRAPMIIGDDGLAVFKSLGVDAIADTQCFDRIMMEELGPDILEVYRRKKED